MRSYYYSILNFFSPFFKYYLKDNLRVLAYHDIKSEAKFLEHILFLKERYNIISLNHVENHIFNNTKLPPNSLLITFDDGDRSVLEKGLPILKQLKVHCCLFIITSLIDTDKDFWFSTVRTQEMRNGKNPSEIQNIMNKLKSVKNWERIIEIRKYNFLSNKQLTSKELIDLKKGGVYIANHSHTHPMFNQCTKEEILQEFKLTFEKFNEFQLPEGHNYFAYPNGNWDVVSEESLKKMGIKMAFLFDHKVNNKNINPLRISRIKTNSDMSINELNVKALGLHSFLQNIKK